MAIYNLDQNEEIDTIKINGVEYEVGDIPVRIMEKIMNIKTGFFKKDNMVAKWLPICQEILEMRNKNVDLTNLTNEKLFAFIEYINLKLVKMQVG